MSVGFPVLVHGFFMFSLHSSDVCSNSLDGLVIEELDLMVGVELRYRNVPQIPPLQVFWEFGVAVCVIGFCYVCLALLLCMFPGLGRLVIALYLVLGVGCGDAVWVCDPNPPCVGMWHVGVAVLATVFFACFPCTLAMCDPTVWVG